MTKKMKVFILIFGVVSILKTTCAHRFIRDQGRYDRYCYTPIGDRGQCVSLKFCPEVLELYRKLPKGQATHYSVALQNICGRKVTNDNYPVLCCTRVVPEPINMDEDSDTTRTSIEVTTPPAEEVKLTFNSTNRSTEDKNPEQNQTLSCRGPELEIGICKPLKDCKHLLESIRSDPSNETLKAYLRSSNEACNSTETNVCCPFDVTSRSHQRLPSEDEGCGLVKISLPKVVGGEDAEMGAWPWIALIGYDPYSLQPFKCGGTLVTAGCVITAAHCLRRDLSFVRLGEYKLSIETESKHVDINVVKTIGHPDFGNGDKRHDIAVLYLEKDVEFTNFISPICLPFSNVLRSKSYLNRDAYVAGWGRTMQGGSASDVLQQVQMVIRKNSDCYTIYSSRNGFVRQEQFDESILCVGGYDGKDTCQGDSGGPLMISEPFKGITRYYLIGIVSYGIGCANLGVPGVYTSTQHHMDWIEQRIAEA